MASWTTLDLLNTVKARAMIPDASTGSLSSATLLQFGTEELHSLLMPRILGCREKYYESYLDTPITANLTQLPIPVRASGGVLAAVQYLYGTDIKPMQPIDPVQAVTTLASSYPTNFWFQNNAIVLYPPPAQAIGTVRMRFPQRPSRLEQTVNCGQITAFDPVGMTVTVSSAPSAWTTGNLLDFIPQTAAQATPYGLNTAITNVSGNVLTFAALPLSSSGSGLVAIGDWVALAEFTPIPEIPFEFQPVLAQATVCRALEAMGDREGLAAANVTLDAKMKDAILLITPRDQAGQKKVVSPWRRF